MNEIEKQIQALQALNTQIKELDRLIASVSEYEFNDDTKTIVTKVLELAKGRLLNPNGAETEEEEEEVVEEVITPTKKVTKKRGKKSKSLSKGGKVGKKVSYEERLVSGAKIMINNGRTGIIMFKIGADTYKIRPDRLPGEGVTMLKLKQDQFKLMED